jgi:hypothetical protein
MDTFFKLTIIYFISAILLYIKIRWAMKNDILYMRALKERGLYELYTKKIFFFPFVNTILISIFIVELIIVGFNLEKMKMTDEN